MKNFWCKISITKLVFLIVMICLCIFTGYQYITWKEITIQLRDSVVTSIVAFYFGQKVWESKKDTLIKEEKDESQI